MASSPSDPTDLDEISRRIGLSGPGDGRGLFDRPGESPPPVQRARPATPPPVNAAAAAREAAGRPAFAPPAGVRPRSAAAPSRFDRDSGEITRARAYTAEEIKQNTKSIPGASRATWALVIAALIFGGAPIVELVKYLISLAT